MKSIHVLATLGLVVVLFLAACTTPAANPGGDSEANNNTPTQETPVDGGQPVSTPAAPAGISNLLSTSQLETIRAWVAQQLGQQSVSVNIVSVEEAAWQDSCLGLGQANESCLQGDTPGYRVVITVNDQQYEVRTNSDLSSIRMTEGAGVTQ